MVTKDYPAYADIEIELLKLLRGSRDRQPKEVYPLLADAFGLTSEQRTRLRPDRPEPEWNNRVQWAKRKLVDEQLMRPAPHGLWSLTREGHESAASIGKVWTAEELGI
jgi:5-methylcytosine-specific restriction protein A